MFCNFYWYICVLVVSEPQFIDSVATGKFKVLCQSLCRPLNVHRWLFLLSDSCSAGSNPHGEFFKQIPTASGVLQRNYKRALTPIRDLLAYHEYDAKKLGNQIYSWATMLASVALFLNLEKVSQLFFNNQIYNFLIARLSLLIESSACKSVEFFLDKHQSCRYDKTSSPSMA